jgi:hypothetical protein
MQWALRHPNMRETLTPMCTQPEFDSQSTRPTPQWSDTQDIGYPYSGSMSFTELLHSHWGPLADDAVPSQWQPQADEAGGSQWYPQSCVDQTPSQHILQTSGQIIRQNGIRSTIILVRTIPSCSDRVPRKLQDRERDSSQTTSRQRTSCIGNVADVIITSGWLSLCTNTSPIIYHFVPVFP